MSNEWKLIDLNTQRQLIGQYNIWLLAWAAVTVKLILLHSVIRVNQKDTKLNFNIFICKLFEITRKIAHFCVNSKKIFKAQLAKRGFGIEVAGIRAPH